MEECRIQELAAIENPPYSIYKLIQFLREINLAYASDAFFTVGILLRTIIGHVPPILGVASFAEVANNYDGAKSFKTLMRKLNDSLRNLADC